MRNPTKVVPHQPLKHAVVRRAIALPRVKRRRRIRQISQSQPSEINRHHVSHASEEKQPQERDCGVNAQTAFRARVAPRRQSFFRARFESTSVKVRLNARPCPKALSTRASRRARAARGHDVRFNVFYASSRTQRICRGRSSRNERMKFRCSHRWRARRSCRRTTTERARRRRDGASVRCADAMPFGSTAARRLACRRARADVCGARWAPAGGDEAWRVGPTELDSFY